MLNLHGLVVFIDDGLGAEYHRKQVIFPRSKKKRIRKKFAKNPTNWVYWKTYKPVIYRVQDKIVMNTQARLMLEEDAIKQGIKLTYREVNG